MFRSFAIVPAAGRSARMGVPKLLLPVRGRAVIGHVLDAWTTSAATHTVVVARADDAALIARCREFAVDVVAATTAPADMKASVRLALAHIDQQYAPAASDAWLLAPADLPRLPATIIDRVLSAYDPADGVAVAPVADGKRGHPVAMPWRAARWVTELKPDEGIDALVARLPLREIPCDDAELWRDLDDPADYDRLAGETALERAVFE